MIKKITSKLKEEGPKNFVLDLLNRILTPFFNVKLTIHNQLKENKVAKQIFQNRKLKYNDLGFYSLDPLPTKKELDYYYKNIYWGAREKYLNEILNKRDLIPFNILSKFVPEFLNKKNIFLNFGSGHGGISHLIWSLGMKCINIEPGEKQLGYQERWEILDKIEKVPNKSVNIIYGSHSLEHVQNIKNFKNEVERILQPNGILFWEVPNAKSPSNGAMKNKIDIPHTYYFKKQFFENWFTDVIFCNCFEQNKHKNFENFLNYENENGEVIIALGKLQKK